MSKLSHCKQRVKKEGGGRERECELKKEKEGKKNRIPVGIKRQGKRLSQHG